MSDGSDRTHDRQPRLSTCPPWCDLEHLTQRPDDDGRVQHDGPVHVLEPVLDGEQQPAQMFVSAAREDVDGLAGRTHLRLSNEGRLLVRLTPAEALDLAHALTESARDAMA